MLQGLKTYLLFGNHFCGIEHTTNNGEDILYVTLLKKSKKEVNIESAFQSNSIAELKEIPKKQHVFLAINNENVLTKSIESEQADGLTLVYKSFPNINLDDFYYEITAQGAIYFVSICRKDYVEALIARYKSQGAIVVNISLGNTIALSITNFIDSNAICSSNSLLTKTNNNIVSIKAVEHKESETYDINGLNVSNHQLLSFSGALVSILNNHGSNSNFEKQLLVSDYTQSRFFNLYLKFGLTFIFGILLINFLFFNHYFTAVNTLQHTSQINQSTRQSVVELNTKVAKTQKMVDDILKSGASKSSFYTNAIVHSLPSSILLSDLNYQPLKKRIKEKQPIEVSSNILLISGASTNSTTFSKWIADLDELKWVNKTEILNYEDVSKSISNFSIKLSLIHE